MATMHLPERPNIDQLRKQARDLQRAIRTGVAHDLSAAGSGAPVPDYPLNQAQLALARHYGFASWARLRRHVDAITARSWSYAQSVPAESLADRFLRLACLNYADDNPLRHTEAAQLLTEHPELPSTALAVAAACADVEQVRRLLARQPSATTTPCGPYGWSALMYATYARMDVDEGAATETVDLLLQLGADPNDGRFFGGLETPFTVLTGCFGGGERSQPAHPHAIALARLLLSHGAEPNDAQTLYNRMFLDEDDFLEVLFEFGLGRGDGGPWCRLLPDLSKPPASLLRTLLHWAVVHDQRARVALLARHGVDVCAAFKPGDTPIALALRNGHLELVEQLRELGARDAPLDPVETFIGSALAGHVARVKATPRDVVEAARKARPSLVVWAAGQQRIEAVGLLVAAGFDVNALGRSDLPIEQEWQSALHTAVERGNAGLLQRLLELGADTQLRDTRFNGTPLEWAHHLGRPELADLLDRMTYQPGDSGTARRIAGPLLS